MQALLQLSGGGGCVKEDQREHEVCPLFTLQTAEHAALAPHL